MNTHDMQIGNTINVPEPGSLTTEHYHLTKYHLKSTEILFNPLSKVFLSTIKKKKKKSQVYEYAIMQKGSKILFLKNP